MKDEAGSNAINVPPNISSNVDINQPGEGTPVPGVYHFKVVDSNTVSFNTFVVTSSAAKDLRRSPEKRPSICSTFSASAKQR
jgi:hypothetical protein